MTEPVLPGDTEPWTIQRIHDGLGHPDLAQRFLAEINRAPAHELLAVFAKWERIAGNLLAVLERADEIIDHVKRGEEPPGTWIDGTERLLAAAARIRACGSPAAHDSRGEGTPR